MGRPRTKTPAWLPRRVYPHHGSYWYKPRIGKAVKLGPMKDPGKCLAEYARIVGDTGSRPKTLGEVIDKYLTEEVPKLAPRTQEDYRAYCAMLKKGLGHFLPDEVTINDLYDYHEARKAPIRANREVTILGLVYRHAIYWRVARDTPVKGFLYRKNPTRGRIVSGSERRRFATSYCPEWLRGYIALKLLTGRRQGELLKLNLFAEKPAGIAFRILKKRQERELIVQWTPRLRKVWKWLKSLPRPKDTPMVFVGARGKPVNSRSLKSVWYRAMQQWHADGNAKFWEHDLRAYSANRAAQAGGVERARELMDHNDARTTRDSYLRERSAKVKPLR